MALSLPRCEASQNCTPDGSSTAVDAMLMWPRTVPRDPKPVIADPEEDVLFLIIATSEICTGRYAGMTINYNNKRDWTWGKLHNISAWPSTFGR